MAKYCVKCGVELKEGVKFCEKCGASVDGKSGSSNNSGSASNSVSLGITNRNIGLAIVLSLVTCGIYGLIWLVSINDDILSVSGSTDEPSGGLVLLLTIVTCGIYGVYWGYKMGQKLFEAGQKYNMNISDNSIVYIILPLFGLGIVSYCLMQNDLNKFS